MSNRIIIIRLIGGLGNQLFQLQYGLNLQLQVGGQLLVDDSFLAKSSKAHETLAIAELIKTLPRVRLGWFDLKAKRTAERLFHKFCIKVPGWLKPAYLFENGSVDPSKMDRVIVDGFWQKAAHLNDGFVLKLQQYLTDYQYNNVGNECVCVHVRRGDYLTNRHWFIKQQVVAPLSYYEDAFTHFRNVLDSPHFEMYTDDEQWATATFGKMADVTVIPSGTLQPFQLLAKMSSYQNYVIANSTLSWWAAVASRLEGKQVVLPKLWGKDMGSEKYRCPGWLAL